MAQVLGAFGAVWALLATAPALADECLCVAWEDTWEWSDCAGTSCACDCTDEVAHGAGTTPDTSGGQVCSDEGLVGTPRTDASCELTSSTCVESDCCDEANADCPGEDGADGGGSCGCDAAGAPTGIAALGLGFAAALRRRRALPR